MNSVNIIGTMTRDIELKYLPSGTAVGGLSIAVNQDYKNQQGQKVEKTSFFEVKVIGKQAETINTYFHKGSRIGISGSLEQESWTTNDGQNRSKVVIKLEGFSFIDKKSNDNQSSQSQGNYQPQQRQKQPKQQSIPEIDIDEEIPF
ncbi:single-stranded DNA-binding protein [Aliarcobacter cryaerophilus]|uniref:single-stranded DNA-binding protein n=1 Tax=Aliarcobacter cryaerophilus TaxID=28198 RepID=UPI0021B6E041|nr:single-stranded DNA-binding protein [Aliarcobacter cryaerophilus]MCT7528773.1 single-stranded DNA-binding protein [Aliarcobacter cryaerophilus]